MNEVSKASQESSGATGRKVARSPFQGVHHLVLTTEDMKTTIDFYTEVMGMRLIHGFKTAPGVAAYSQVRGNPPFDNIRHYFFDMGNNSLLGFFEMPKGAKEQSDRNAIGGMQHLSFFMPEPADYEALMERLRARGIRIFGPKRMDSAPGYSFYFFDPNGCRLEVSCHPDRPFVDPEGREREPTRAAEEGGAVDLVEIFSQSRAELAQELATLHDDPAWIRKVTSGLPE